jgi:hypothetical protein
MAQKNKEAKIETTKISPPGLNTLLVSEMQKGVFLFFACRAGISFCRRPYQS